jgi:hypothetical protein
VQNTNIEAHLKSMPIKNESHSTKLHSKDFSFKKVELALSSKDSDFIEPEIDSENDSYSGVLNLKNSADTQKYF